MWEIGALFDLTLMRWNVLRCFFLKKNCLGRGGGPNRDTCVSVHACKC